MSEWRRPYGVNWSNQIIPALSVLVAICLCFHGAPLFIAFPPPDRWGMAVQNPWVDLWVGLVLVDTLYVFWRQARAGVYISDTGVMVRTPGSRHRTVVPWQQIAYARIAQVPSIPVIWQRGPSLGLVLMTPSGHRRPVPARLPALKIRRVRSLAPYVVLNQRRMNQVVNRINEIAALQHPQPLPPQSGWLTPPL